jgi:hypothetical protein
MYVAMGCATRRRMSSAAIGCVSNATIWLVEEGGNVVRGVENEFLIIVLSHVGMQIVMEEMVYYGAVDGGCHTCITRRTVECSGGMW